MQRSYKTQNRNFRKNQKVQVRQDGQWRDYTIPCTMKLAIELALKAEQIYGFQNVKVITI